MFANAHFRGKDDPAWTAADFLGGNRQQRQQDALGLQREKSRDALMSRQMKQVKTRADIEQFELEHIPKWARMTEEEKARL